ncbi:MAG: hypothetical protein NTY38_06745 [Acidobacteria bacterium]|nr:hypothetical protein [Acidobacteriota bacterium]
MLPLGDGRSITIHAEEESTKAGNSDRVFFHKPIFAFEENPVAVDNLPSLFWAEETEGGFVYMQVRLVLSSPEVREAAKAAIRAQYRSLQSPPSASDPTIEVNPWPAKILRLQAQNSTTYDSYGSAVSGALNTAGDVVEMNLAVPQDKYKRFIDAIKSNRVTFSPSYTFENAIIAIGRSSLEVSAKVSQGVSELLNSKQVKAGEPIFQDNASQLTSDLDQRIVQTIQATDATILSKIPSVNISGFVLEPPKVVTLDSMRANQDNALLGSVKKYIEAVANKVSTTRKTTNQNQESKESESTKKLGGSYGSQGPGISVDITDKDKTTLTNTYGIEFTESSDKTVIEPHSIRIQYLRSSWQQNFTEIIQRAYLAVGVSREFEFDSSFKAAFTRAALERTLPQSLLSAVPFSGIQNGMAFCSFAETVPSGFVALDGSEVYFRYETWVPTTLRGKRIPDMRGKFARGATVSNEIGKPFTDGKITVPGDKIDGAGFKLSSTGTLGALPWVADGVLAQAFVPSGEDWQASVGFKRFDNVVGGLAIISRPEYMAGAAPSWPNVAARASLHLVEPKILPAPQYGQLQNVVATPDKTVGLNVPSAQPDNVSCRWIMRMDKN